MDQKQKRRLWGLNVRAAAALAGLVVLVFAVLANVEFPRVGAGEMMSAGRAEAIPAAATAFRLGRLQFTRCELPQPRSGATTPAFCAPFSVPENWDAPEPEGRRIDLRLALIKSEAEAAERDIVVFLDGGPGQAATEDYPAIAGALAGVRRRRHILLLDQRGTGGSNPLRCPAPRAQSALAGAGAAAAAEINELAECVAAIRSRADPAQYTTTAAVRDLEALRIALGAPPFDLVGVSYGTRVAQQYLMRHPQAVRAAVLDGPVPNEAALGAEVARNLDAALQAHFARCAAHAACVKAVGDPWANLRALRQKLRAQPRRGLAVRDPRSFAATPVDLDAENLAGWVRLFAYQPETAALLPLA
jgi:pimeloyl-ACP methyl ester carboxylesterase